VTPVGRRLVLVAGAALLLLGIFSASLVAVREPLAIGDYVGIWGLKARALYRAGSFEGLFRADPGGDFSHPEYPPLWPLLLAGFSGLSGRYDDLVVTLLWPLLCLAASLLAIRAARASPPFAALAGAAVALLPYWRRYPGYAEGLLLVLLLAALGEVERLDTDGAALVRFALFLTLASWTKPEGAAAALLAAAVLLGARRRRAGLLTGLSALLLAVLPWTLTVKLLDPSTPRTDFSPSSFSLEKMVTAFAVIVREGLLPHAGWLAGAIALLALAPATRRRRRAVLLWCAVYPTVLVASFAFSRLDPAWHMHWAWDRLAFIPVAVLLPVLGEALAECAESRTAAQPRGRTA
jgi:hypothetical protein